MYQLLWIFFLYAFLGWCTEVSYAALRTGKFVNRGFLNGPICPIYGCGSGGGAGRAGTSEGKLRAAVSGFGGPHLRPGVGHRLCVGKAVPPAVVGLL